MTSSNNQMHNDIMESCSKERPPMLAPGSYAYGDLAVPAKGDDPGQPRVVREETYANTSKENKKLISPEGEAIYMILNRISNDIYSTVDAYHITREMW
ncbi:hypothetical protein Tco_0927053 [Tanacetum coccineum]|uniref:Uncharacterized protein n=1 Tax=Tanacetum coccineum TaxID=301880 RepID=A0ABQ5DCB1_9ASTR